MVACMDEVTCMVCCSHDWDDYFNITQQNGAWILITPILNNKEEKTFEWSALVKRSANWELDDVYAVEITPS